jgi:hypothetical protein
MSKIVSYKVGVTRSHKRGATRWLTLRLDPAAEGPRTMTLFFHEEQVSGLGFLNEETSTLVVNFPVADFRPIYEIVQTEEPVYAHYRLDPEDQRLLSLDVSTSEEPLGEGHADRSP